MAKPKASKFWLKESPPKFELGSTGEILTKNIKIWISKRGFTTFESFAFACNIPKSTLSQIINRTRDPQLGTLEQIAYVLGITVAELFTVPHPLPPEWDSL